MSFVSATGQASCDDARLEFTKKPRLSAFRPCFALHQIPGCTRSYASNSTLRSVDAYRKRSQFVTPRPVAPTRSVVLCKQEDGGGNASGLEGEIREMYERSMRENPLNKRELQDSDRRVMDDITETGVTKINEIVRDMNQDLKDIQKQAAQRATAMIREESDLLLQKYEQKRVDILDKVKSDRQIIKDELTKLERLAGGMEKERTKDDRPTKEKILLASTMAFTVAALCYAWNGLVNADASALSKAAVDAVVAAAAGYFASRRRA